ncbi:MAG: DUF2975 domain-containing protein [Bacteroidales bacterium]|nr:DUF2975 domain-containing protein [Bacteroidales bacterium]
MIYRKILSTLVYFILAGHIIVAMSYGFRLYMYDRYIRSYEPTSSSVEDSKHTSHRTFKYWFLDYRLSYSYSMDSLYREKETFVLSSDIAELIPKYIDDNKFSIKLRNKKTGKTENYWLESSSMFIPLDDSHEHKLHHILSFITISIIFYSFFIFYMILKIIRSLKRGTPFTRINVNRFLIIGLMVTILPLFFAVIDISFIRMISGAWIFEDYWIFPTIDFNLELLLGGILLIFIAEIIRNGVKIQEEQELTI